MSDFDADRVLDHLSELGYGRTWIKEMPAGRVAWLRLQLTSTDIACAPVAKLAEGIEQFWSYGSYGQAFEAAVAWNTFDEPEPQGWLRHKPSSRRRPDGDASREYVAE